MAGKHLRGDGGLEETMGALKANGRHDDAVELAPETFVELDQGRDRCRPRGGESSTGLFTIASNLAKKRVVLHPIYKALLGGDVWRWKFRRKIARGELISGFALIAVYHA
jgi:hypothetical protein